MIGTEGNILATERFKGDDTQYYLYNKDIQGSTTSLVKEDGSADATYQYTDYGETIIHGDDQAKNEVCYTGGIYDQSTGLYYLNARYYDPEDGRFMTEDSYRGEIMNPETGHLYVYCTNNPVNYVDPSGHFAAAMYTVIKLVLVGGAVAYVSYSSWKNHSSKTKYAGRKIISKTKVSVWLTAGVVDRIIYSKSKKKSNTKKKRESKKSKKERATDIPSWAHGSRPKKGESGNEYAIRKMNEHYGKGKWARKGKQGKEYSELRKWGDRGR